MNPTDVDLLIRAHLEAPVVDEVGHEPLVAGETSIGGMAMDEKDMRLRAWQALLSSRTTHLEELVIVVRGRME